MIYKNIKKERKLEIKIGTINIREKKDIYNYKRTLK